MKLKSFDVFDCFFSGGRDSALACYIANKVAKNLTKKFRLVHVDTGVALRETREYVERYASWMGSDLIVLRTPYDYFEYVAKYGYPNIVKNRWCWRLLKREPLYQFRVSELKEGVNALWVLGIRSSESIFRLEKYRKLASTLTAAKIKDLPVVEWLPVLHLDGKTVEALIEKFGIPKSPVWHKIGMSGDCICLAATHKKALEALFLNYPDVAEKFYKFDKSLTPRDRSYPIPFGLWNEKKRLYEFIEEIQKNRRQAVLTEYMSCQGSCFVL